MSSDDSSELSDVPSDVETDLQLTKKDGILKFFSKAPPPSAAPKAESPPRPKREPSPPHEYVLADNQDIPVGIHHFPIPFRALTRRNACSMLCSLANAQPRQFTVMFRSRFTEAFPKSLINFGPQELERDIVEPVPGEGVEHFLCALLGLLLNRKQDVK